MSIETLSDVRTTAQLGFVNCKLSDSVNMAFLPNEPDAVVIWNEDSQPTYVALRRHLMKYAKEGKTFGEYIDKFDAVKAFTLNTPLDLCLAQAKVEQEASQVGWILGRDLEDEGKGAVLLGYTAGGTVSFSYGNVQIRHLGGTKKRGKKLGIRRYAHFCPKGDHHAPEEETTTWPRHGKVCTTHDNSPVLNGDPPYQVDYCPTGRHLPEEDEKISSEGVMTCSTDDGPVEDRWSKLELPA